MTEVFEERMEKVEAELGEVKKARLEKQKVLKDCQRYWNKFIRNLLGAIVNWEAYSKLCISERIEIDEFPLEVQKTFVRFNPKGDFGFMIEDIFANPNVKELLKELLIKNEVKGD